MDNKQQKQTFLFKEIIQSNYDPQQFQQFMMNFKQGVDDIDQWSMNDLRQVVKQFKQQLNQNKKNSNSIVRSSIMEDDKQSSFGDSKIQSPKKRQALEQDHQYNYLESSSIVMKQEGKYSEYDPKSKHQIFSQTIQCIIIPPNSLLTKDIDIKVQNFTKKQGGILKQSYVSYTIFTSFLNTRVERRYSDFQWLKKNLQILHPGLPVPPIAKKGQFRRYDDKHVHKRMMILQMFLNKLMEIPQLKAEMLVQNFLKISQKAEFDKFKLSFKGMTSPSNLSKLKNMKGKVNLSIEPRINTFLVKAQKNIAQTQPQMKKIYKAFKSAATMLQGCGATLKGIAQVCQDLDKKDQTFRKKVEIKYCPNNIFTCLGEATVRLAEQLEKQAKTYRQMFHSLIKYQSLHMLNMLDFFDSLAQTQKNYQDTKNALMRKKLKLYEQGNMTKWGTNENLTQKPEKNRAIEIMLPKQTKQLQKMRQKYGLFNFQMYEELNRFYTSKNFNIGKFLQQYCRTQTRISSQMMMIWVDMETNVMTMRQNKYIQKC